MPLESLFFSLPLFPFPSGRKPGPWHSPRPVNDPMLPRGSLKGSLHLFFSPTHYTSVGQEEVYHSLTCRYTDRCRVVTSDLVGSHIA